MKDEKIKIGQIANVINNTSDCIKILGKDFSGTGWTWLQAITKNIPSKEIKKAVPIFNELKDSGQIDIDDSFNWSFKKEENE